MRASSNVGRKAAGGVAAKQALRLGVGERRDHSSVITLCVMNVKRHGIEQPASGHLAGRRALESFTRRACVSAFAAAPTAVAQAIPVEVPASFLPEAASGSLSLFIDETTDEEAGGLASTTREQALVLAVRMVEKLE
jgi:hypothetical protein